MINDDSWINNYLAKNNIENLLIFFLLFYFYFNKLMYLLIIYQKVLNDILKTVKKCSTQQISKAIALTFMYHVLWLKNCITILYFYPRP